MENILLKPFETPYNAVPFDAIKAADFKAAIVQEISKSKQEIEEIEQQKEAPNFQNTIEKLEACGEHLGIITGVLFNLNSAETSTELQNIAQEIAPMLSAFQNDIHLNEKLFSRVQQLHQKLDKKQLTEEQKTLLDKTYKSFVRNGALLTEKEKERLRTIDGKLAQLSLRFGTHVLADKNAYSLQVTDKEQLNGVPETALIQAKKTAEEKGKEGWIFTLDYPSYLPFMTYAENRALRKELSTAFGKTGFQENENNNEKLILDIVQLRQERAQLLGYSSHAAFVLEERMAESETNVKQFLNKLKSKAFPVAKKEWQEMEAYAKSTLGYEKLEKWDTAFVAEKIKKARFDLDEQALKPYLPLPKVLEGLFHIVFKLYGLQFKLAQDIPTYHTDVNCYEVYKDDTFLSLLYTDFHPREGKRSGAWMTSYRSQKKEQRPHVSIVCNFSPPTEDAPALLTFNEVTTLFHEFGHALHGMLANTTYSSLSGTSVFWDFVELPSQIMENWCYEAEALALFTGHYKTGETLPLEEVKKIRSAAQFHQGLQTLRQLSFGTLDLSWHNEEAHKITEVKAHEKEIMQEFQFSKDTPSNCMSTAFSHIFQGGYAAGYYSYKWAEVLDADAFELFLEKGIFDPATAEAFYENILSKGGTQHPMELYRAFRGKKPNPEALLRRSGLV